MQVLVGCSGDKEYILNEKNFFLVMTGMQYYPEKYLYTNIEYDCFTYTLKDVNGVEYTCGVRKCSSEYGCTCGNDTIIGFLLEGEVDLPAPKNQSADNNDKSWVHLQGKLKSATKKNIEIYAYLENGEIDTTRTEILSFLTFTVESATIIEDYSNLNYYVTK